MAGDDVNTLADYVRRGFIGRVDFFVGEIFKGSYPEAYARAAALCKSCGGRMVTFRNHAKVMIIHGDRFDCLIESSANVNTNPRCENTVLTVDSGLARAYAELFSGIRSFDRDFDHVPPYTW